MASPPAPTLPWGTGMSDRAAALAAHFRDVHQRFVDCVARIPCDLWSADCPSEHKSVCAVAHHIADGYDLELRAFRAIAAGRRGPPLTREQLDEGNADRATRAVACGVDEVRDAAGRNFAAMHGFIAG